MRTIHLCVVASLCIALAGLSCSKSNDGPTDEDPVGGYYIRYKANGENHEYTHESLIHAFILTLPETGAHQCLIQGRRYEDDQNRDAVFFVVTDPIALKSGVAYRLSDRLEWPEYNQSVSQVYGSHYNASGEKYFAQLYQLPSLPFEVKDDATVRFSEITDKTVKGTFSMRAFTTYPDLKEVMITDGEFYVPVLASNTNR